MRLEDFAAAMRELPTALTIQDYESLDKAGDAVADKARDRIPVRTGVMRASIMTRRLHRDTEQIYSNHPGARVNEQDPRWRHPPRHWLTTSLIDSMPEILHLFADGARDAIRSVIRR